MFEEEIPQWAQKMQLCLDGIQSDMKISKSDIDTIQLDMKIIKSDIDTIQEKQITMPLKIKQELLPQLVIEIRNTIKSGLN